MARNCLSNSAGSIFNSLRITAGVSHVVGEILQHGENGVPAPLIGDEIADAAGLVIAHQHLFGSCRDG